MVKIIHKAIVHFLALPYRSIADFVFIEQCNIQLRSMKK